MVAAGLHDNTKEAARYLTERHSYEVGASYLDARIKCNEAFTEEEFDVIERDGFVTTFKPLVELVAAATELERAPMDLYREFVAVIDNDLVLPFDEAQALTDAELAGDPGACLGLAKWESSRRQITLRAVWGVPRQGHTRARQEAQGADRREHRGPSPGTRSP